MIFSAGDYLLAALEAFDKNKDENKLVMGTTNVWQMGIDPFPTVKLCQGTAAQKAALVGFIKNITAPARDAPVHHAASRPPGARPTLRTRLDLGSA